MGRGLKPARGARSANACRSVEGPGLTLGDGSNRHPVLPPGFAASLQTPALDPEPKLRKRPAAMINLDGTLHPDAFAVLDALQTQMIAQALRKDWNGSRIPNAVIKPPQGMSITKTKKILTPLRAAGLVKAKNGMWWVLPQGRAVLEAGPRQDSCPCGGGLVLIHRERRNATDVVLLGDPDAYVKLKILSCRLLPGERSFDHSDDWQVECEECSTEFYANMA